MPNPSVYEEKVLLLKVAEGDEIAFRQLFLHWHQLLAGYVFRITESHELTEEIVQDVFLKIWITRETLSEIDHFKHYLLVVSRNQAFDVLKKLSKERALKQAWEKESEQDSTIENGNTRDKWSSLIDEAIDSLPPRRKEVWLLSRHERLTYEEIADRLGILRSSVKTHLELATSSITRYIRSHLLKLVVLTFFKNF